MLTLKTYRTSIWMLLIGVSVLLLAKEVDAQDKKLDFGDFTVHYSMDNGKLHGAYEAFYENGQKRVVGEFINGHRTDEWIFWDRKGDTITKRVYSSPFAFERKHPKVPEQGPYELLSGPIYEPKRNEKGYIERFYLHSRAISWQVNVYRRVKKKHNPTLFNEDRLLKAFYRALKNDTAQIAYKDSINPLDSLMPIEKIEEYWFRFFEGWFFDHDRFILDNKILGISPVVKNGEDTNELIWAQYPPLKKHYGKEPIPKASSRESDLDAHLFYDAYSGTVYSSFIPEQDGFLPKPHLHPHELVLGFSQGEKQQDSASAAKRYRKPEYTDIFLRELEHKTWKYYMGR